MPGKRHEQAVERLIEQGYQRNGFVATVRKYLQAEGEDTRTSGIPRPDAWRQAEIDGFEVLECVEVVVSHLEDRQLSNYASLWFHLDSLSHAPILRLFLLVADLEPSEYDLCDKLYQDLQRSSGREPEPEPRLSSTDFLREL
jgi:hypothetical protein